MGRPAKPHWLLEDEDFKDCRKCGVRQKGHRFRRSKKAVDGRDGSCKSCQNEAKRSNPSGQPEYRRAMRVRSQEYDSHYNRFYKYGITKDEFLALVEEQGGCCALCGLEKKLTVDHDHSDGRIRGLLCSPCNGGLGKLGDSIEGLQRAIDYIRRSQP